MIAANSRAINREFVKDIIRPECRSNRSGL